MNPRRRRFIVALPCTLAAIVALSAMKPAQTRTLSFAERVAYQRAIEEVYWRHRIWPNERSEPKPALDQVMTQAQIEHKVADYLRNSQALEDYWQRPLTAEQLQAEMDRMATHTKQPEVLRELFAALGNDPFLIAECLARPALAERLATNWYAFDERFHGELKRRAETELQAHPSVEQMKQTSGAYSEIEFVKSDSGDNENSEPGAALKLNSREWDELVEQLAAAFGDSNNAEVRPADLITQLKTGVSSSLQQGESQFYATAIVRKSEDRLSVATVAWRKEPFESWRATVSGAVVFSTVLPSSAYRLAIIPDSPKSCSDDTWSPVSAPPEARQGHTAVWTGSEMIVWGGQNFSTFIFNSGGRYNPSTDSWSVTTTTNAPSARFSHTAVWTGTEMVIWGGAGISGNVNTGGKYNPGTDSWIATNTTNAPTARDYHTAVWTGSEMVVWGGADNSGVALDTGGRYNPGADSWTATNTLNAAPRRWGHTAVWTGSKMIIWAGVDSSGVGTSTGGLYDPATNSWTATSAMNAPAPRYRHTAVWSGTEMVAWGGVNGGTPFNTGGRYDPSANIWISTTTANAPANRELHSAVWTGSEMVIWGGAGTAGNVNTGGKYNPGTNTWTATTSLNAPSARAAHTGVWTGTEMLVWGGAAADELNDGGRYNPNLDSWTVAGSTPSNRARHTAVWTGSEMIVWGGFVQDGNVYLNTGGKYSPSTDTWTMTSLSNAPVGRYLHTAVWTGTEMIIWGGAFFDPTGHYLNTGGKYNPGIDSWTATSTTNVPAGRYFHSAVWTGTEMIVWGGYFFDTADHYLSTGGRYNPGTDSWTATGTVNAPSRRDAHKAVWSSSEMIIWGGFNGSSYLGTGGKYNPSTNSWIATSTTNAPSGRTTHAALWTGSEMIVWGGFDGINYAGTGARYNPTANTWTSTSSINAPSARAVYGPEWTGNEMIIWGGYDGFNYLGDGGRYDPATDNWTITSNINAPAGRYRHSGVWTGDELIIWGGVLSSNIYTNTGGRYCAQSAAPTPTPTPTATPTVTPSPTPTPTPATIRVSVTAAPTQINEGQSANYTVTASAAVAQSTTVNYAMSGTATLGADYSLSGTVGQVTILAGQTSAAVRLKAKTDGAAESTETAIMTLQNGSGYRPGNPKQATVSIVNVP